MYKILFITFEFNPVQTTGNFRPAKFVKYLRKFGIEPVVLCGEEKSILEYYKSGKVNAKLEKEIPADVLVARVPFDKPYSPSSKYEQFFFYADLIYRHWNKNAYERASDLIHKNP